MKILDSDTCIAILRGNTQVLARRESDPDEVATTWVTAEELYFGAMKSLSPEKNRNLVGLFLSTLPILVPDIAAAQVFGEAKALLHKAGTPVADADLIIASIAIRHGAVVVTGNTRHFVRIPGLRTEDWIRG